MITKMFIIVRAQMGMGGYWRHIQIQSVDDKGNSYDEELETREHDIDELVFASFPSLQKMPNGGNELVLSEIQRLSKFEGKDQSMLVYFNRAYVSGIHWTYYHKDFELSINVKED